MSVDEQQSSARSHDPQEQRGDLAMRRWIDGAAALFKARAVKRTHLVDEREARRADTALRRDDSHMKRRSSVSRRERDTEA
jgi:hypothetical protein